MRRFDPARRAVHLAAAVSIAFTTPASEAAGDIARGRTLAAPCSECHGAPQRAPLAGTPYLAGQPAQFVELQLIMMREGLREVPQMTGLLKGVSDRDIGDLAAHFSQQTPPPTRARRNPARYERGATLAREMICGNCHGEDFRGQKHLPRLASQREDYLVISLKAYRDNKRVGIDTSMNELMYGVADSDIDALAHFLSHQ